MTVELVTTSSPEIAGAMFEGLDPVLQERELYIVVHRYGLFGNKAMTQREIASAVGMSRSYGSRIEKKALDKLKKSFCE